MSDNIPSMPPSADEQKMTKSADGDATAASLEPKSHDDNIPHADDPELSGGKENKVDDAGNVKKPAENAAAAAAADDHGAKVAEPSININTDSRPDTLSEGSSSTETSDTDVIMDEDEEDEDNDIVATSPSDDPTELIMQAVTHKEEGNTFFKSGDLIKASRSYRRGTSVLKNLNKHNTGDDQVKALLLSLQTNLSMVCFKQNKHKMSRDVATKALVIDSTNVKALYRRAVANRKLGDLDAAKADLKEALKHDPENAAVKRELLSIKKEVDAVRSKEKERLQKAFSKKGTGSFLYEDREEEMKRKEAEKRAKEEAEKEALKKRKIEWEDECVKRMSRNEPAISFEDWEKERKKKEEDEEKARRKAKKEEEERKKAERKAARAASKKRTTDSDSSDDEDFLKDVDVIRGYKKTSDGRTTSYFTREQTEEEKAMIGDITPQRLDADVNAPTPAPVVPTGTTVTAASAAVNSPSDLGKQIVSAWNQAGTWEERDTTDWCTSRLRSRLKETTVTFTPYIATIKSVKDLKGDASIAFAGGKKRYIFDYHAKVAYEIKDDNSDDDDSNVVATGTLNLPDISSTVTNEDLEVDVLGWKRAPPKDDEVNVTACQKLLVEAMRKSVLSFVEDFNAHY